MVTQEKHFSAADLWALSHQPHNKDKRLELVAGVIIEMSPAGGKHGFIASRLDRLIGNFVEENDLGYTTAAETGYILSKNPHGRDTVRAPDVGYVSKGRLPEGLPDGYIPFAPDLAVEVVSPHDSASAMHDRVTDFLKHGTRLVWVFYPTSQSVAVHTPEGAFTLEAGDTLDGGEVLPGFRLRVGDVFS